MKIAVLQSEGRLFPQCEEIAQVVIADVDPVTHGIRQTTLLTPPSRAADALAEWLRGQEVEIVLTSGIRQRHCDLLEENGIQVITGVPPFRVEPVLANFLAGRLETGANACEQTTGGSG